MRFFLSLFLGAIFIFIGVQVYSLNSQRVALRSTAETLEKEVKDLTENNSVITADLEYISNNLNMIKDLKSKFNYRAPDEKLFILVPPVEQ